MNIPAPKAVEALPKNNLPSYDECRMRVHNSDFIEKRLAEGGYGPEADSKLATQLHRFIHEYDDADPVRSAWFLHRLELLLEETKVAALAAAQAEQAKPDALAELEARKDAAYLERNQVVAALAKAFPSGVARTAIEGWSEDWHGCVYIDLPTGQASWHFHDSQAHLFDGLPPYTGKWDGHDTPEKYRRLAALSPQPPSPDVERQAVATVYTMEALVPGPRRVVMHATFHKDVPAGTKLYAGAPPQEAGDADAERALDLEGRTPVISQKATTIVDMMVEAKNKKTARPETPEPPDESEVPDWYFGWRAGWEAGFDAARSLQQEPKA
jgi:hypothetical protein